MSHLTSILSLHGLLMSDSRISLKYRLTIYVRNSLYLTNYHSRFGYVPESHLEADAKST